jgi:hypothetical protein
MSDWPDIDGADYWEPDDSVNSGEDVNVRLQILMGTSWTGKDVDVIKWSIKYDPPRWAMWEKRQAEPEEPGGG